MFSRKLFYLYGLLLILALATMGALVYFKVTHIPLRDYTEVKQEGVLRMVTEYNQSGYFISDQVLQGFQYELSREIAKLAGVEVQVHLEMSLDKSFEGLNKNLYDVVARNIPITSELKEEYLFLEPIVLNKQVLVQRKPAHKTDRRLLRNQLELGKKTLYVPQNSPALQRLSNLQHEIGDTIHVVQDPLYSSEQLIIRVARGEIDYAVCDQQIAQIAQKQFPEIDTQTDISFTQLQAWVVRKNAPILGDSLNAWLQQIRDNGTYNRIYKHYYLQNE